MPKSSHIYLKTKYKNKNIHFTIATTNVEHNESIRLYSFLVLNIEYQYNISTLLLFLDVVHTSCLDELIILILVSKTQLTLFMMTIVSVFPLLSIFYRESVSHDLCMT